MKAAKADKEEIDRVQKFYNLVESLLDSRWGDSDEDWRTWDDKDEDKKEILEIEEELKLWEGTDLDGHVDNRIVLYEFFKKRFKEVDWGGSIGRVLMNADVLVNQVCDPDLDYLDFNPEIKQALELWNEQHPEEDNEETNKEDAR